MSGRSAFPGSWKGVTIANFQNFCVSFFFFFCTLPGFPVAFSVEKQDGTLANFPIVRVRVLNHFWSFFIAFGVIFEPGALWEQLKFTGWLWRGHVRGAGRLRGSTVRLRSGARRPRWPPKPAQSGHIVLHRAVSASKWWPKASFQGVRAAPVGTHAAKVALC